MLCYVLHARVCMYDERCMRCMNVLKCMYVKYVCLHEIQYNKSKLVYVYACIECMIVCDVMYWSGMK